MPRLYACTSGWAKLLKPPYAPGGGGVLHDPVLVAALPCRLRQHGITEGDDAPDDADTLRVQLGNGGRQRVARLHRADLLGQRNGRVVAADAALVLEIELDGVDLMVVD